MARSRLAPWGLTVAFMLAACGGPHYTPPKLPPEQLALVKADDRATILSVDGLAPESGREFYVATGCRTLSVRYDASYTSGSFNPLATPVLDVIPKAAAVESHHYETMKPIRFLVPTKPGETYWVTASFNGDQFMPRIAELDPASGEATSTILPDVACP